MKRLHSAPLISGLDAHPGGTLSSSVRLAAPFMFVAVLVLVSVSFTPAVRRGPVLVFSSLKIAPYQRIVKTLRDKVGRYNSRVFYLDRDPGATDSIARLKPSAIVTVGREALEKTLPLHDDIPLVFTMVLFYRQVLPRPRPDVRGIAMTPSPESEFRILRNGFGFKRVTVFYNPKKTGSLVKLLAEAGSSGVELRAIKTTSLLELNRRLPETLDKTSACLLVPDPSVLTEEGFKAIINGCFERGVPIVGFSPMYIDMGAAITISVPEREMAAHAARLTSKSPIHAELHDGVYYIGRPDVTVNRTVCNRLKTRINESYIRSAGSLKWRGNN